ncbi:hypothetical protein CEP52_003063 [Fusarium oligoseptatum]|uniref:Uncharacterized protein n=1 Tax=Fusarium oligoseptatum TaxID=2604345 RepID=A0A428UAV5_9HYPO|nr:hypothetical protein CEP52_003063 [Fusarium oligoseptatum]
MAASFSALGAKQSADEWCARFQNVWRPISPHTGRSNGQVRVAVLDTGVDEAVLEKYGENIRGKKNFLYEADRDQDEKSDDSDADDSDDADPDILDQDANRHGSHVVELILKLVPCVDIYVARIAKDCASNMDPACIAKAIEYASEQWDVHIISMSWGFENRHEVIERAIELASKREKIMFAAASNLGANGPRGFRVTFPASRPDVICINSADGHGKYSSFNPGKRKGSFNFLTLGEAVPAAKHAKDRSQPEVRLTGTSYATPIAAAIAASFIEFVMQKPLGKERKLRDEVTTRDGMIKLFAGMSEDKTEGFRWLQPWHLIRCDEHSDSHNCKSCRKESAQRVRKLLEGPLPLPDDRVLLPDLPHVPEAEVESQLGEERSDCIHGTRVELLQQIQAWIDDKGGSPIWWLIGNTGTGKSTVARTVARNLRSEKKTCCEFFLLEKPRELLQRLKASHQYRPPARKILTESRLRNQGSHRERS